VGVHLADWPGLGNGLQGLKRVGAGPRRQGSHVRIVSGAPFAYKTTNISVRVLFAGNDRLQNVFVANDPDGLVVDLDGIDD
jgi:hypothetical protein